MKKLFNVILSLGTIALFVLFIYSKIIGAVPFGTLGQFLLDYGSLILLGLFTFNNLLAKVTSIFLILFIIAVILLVIVFVNPNLLSGVIAK